ncbi:MAG: hypothetical protein U9O96_07795 [Candidatus Thermoplasmatota archaeon]|nr:hypothetical protein [Candidatus Thermoplasmatota archaeon]
MQKILEEAEEAEKAKEELVGQQAVTHISEAEKFKLRFVLSFNRERLNCGRKKHDG